MGRSKNKESKKPQKAKMLEEASKLFWKKGFNATSMRDIAKAYGCEPANIYNFFSSKEEILYEVLLEEMEQIIDPIRYLEHNQSLNPFVQLRLFIENHLRVTLRYRRSAKLLFDIALDSLSSAKRKSIIELRDTYDRIIRNIISRGKDAGQFSDVDEKLAGLMIASMITRSRLWFQIKKGITVDELADFIFQFTLNGLTNKVGSSEKEPTEDLSHFLTFHERR